MLILLSDTVYILIQMYVGTSEGSTSTVGEYQNRDTKQVSGAVCMCACIICVSCSLIYTTSWEEN